MSEIYIVVLLSIYNDDTIISPVFFGSEEDAKEYADIMLEQNDYEPFTVNIRKLIRA